jgi:hypothetical protein
MYDKFSLPCISMQRSIVRQLYEIKEVFRDLVMQMQPTSSSCSGRLTCASACGDLSSLASIASNRFSSSLLPLFPMSRLLEKKRSLGGRHKSSPMLAPAWATAGADLKKRPSVARWLGGRHEGSPSTAPY